jgi:hypothetical protein
MILKKLTVTIAGIVLYHSAISQNVEFEKGNFSGRKEELKDAMRKLEVGIDF